MSAKTYIKGKDRDLESSITYMQQKLGQLGIEIEDEVRLAPNAMMAAEMAIIRLTHVADLPSPEELVRRLSDAPPPPAPGPGPGTAVQNGKSSDAQAVARAQTRMAGSPNASGQTTALARDLAGDRELVARHHLDAHSRLPCGRDGCLGFFPGRIEQGQHAQKLP